MRPRQPLATLHRFEWLRCIGCRERPQLGHRGSSRWRGDISASLALPKSQRIFFICSYFVSFVTIFFCWRCIEMERMGLPKLHIFFRFRHTRRDKRCHGLLVLFPCSMRIGALDHLCFFVTTSLKRVGNLCMFVWIPDFSFFLSIEHGVLGDGISCKKMC